jgi:hypothetical protein
MIRREASDGPYGRWLREAAELIGPRIWKHLFWDVDDCDVADAIFEAYGVKPFRKSRHYQEMLDAIDGKDGPPTESKIVTLVDVTYDSDDLREIEPDEDDKILRDPLSTGTRETGLDHFDIPGERFI